MKIILSFVLVLNLLFVNNVYSMTPVDSPEFSDTGNCFFPPANATCESGNWYLDYIGMQYVYDNNLDLFPSFTVGLFDTVLDKRNLINNHEDIDYDLIFDLSDLYGYSYDFKNGYLSHANMTASLFSAGTIANGLGGRGIINAKTLFLSFLAKSDYLDPNGNNYAIGDKNFTVIEGLNRLLNYPNQGTFSKPKVISISAGISSDTELQRKGINFDLGKHLKASQEFRHLFQSHPDVLFVIAAGNASTDTKKENGAVHYEYIGNPDIESEKFDPDNYILSKLSNVIVVAANGPDGVLHGYSNFGESVDISAPSGVFAASCVKADTWESTYLEKISNEWYGYSFYSKDLSNNEDETLKNLDNPDYHKACIDGIGSADGTSTATPITAGASGLLFANTNNLNPADIKEYLLYSDGIIRTGIRYNDNPKTPEMEYGTLCPDQAFIESCSLKIPLLNIEKSMKQYEADHTIVEDFVGIFDRLKNSSFPINFIVANQPFISGNINGVLRYLQTDYIGDNAVNSSDYPTKSLKWDLSQTSTARLFFIIQNYCYSDCIYNLSFNYKTDVERYVGVMTGNYFLLDFTLPVGEGQKNISFMAPSSSSARIINFMFNRTGNLHISDMSLNGINFDQSNLVSAGQQIRKYTDDKNITYSYKDSSFQLFSPTSQNNFFQNEYLQVLLGTSSKYLEIDTPFVIKKSKFTYTTSPYVNSSSPYIEVYDENNNRLYYDYNLPVNGVIRNADFEIPSGTSKLKILGVNTTLYIDKIEYTYQ